MTATNAAVYCRVSTKDQRDAGSSLDTQRAAGLAKAATLGWSTTPAHVIQEDWTGSDLERPGLRRLFDLVTSGAVQGVVLHTIDRLYRPEPGDEWRVFEVMARLKAAGAEIAFVDASIPTSGPLVALATFIKALQAGTERSEIRRRTSDGRTARVTDFKKPLNPRLYGYVGVKGRMREPEAGKRRVDPKTGPVVVDIFTAAAAGQTLYKIIHALQQRGIPSPTGKPVWGHASLLNLLQNPAYKGETFGNRVRGTPPKRRRPDSQSRRLANKPRPRDEWVELPGITPPLVSEEVWERAQVQVSTRRERRKSPAQSDCILTGVLWCACGARMVGVSTGHGKYRRRWYRCTSGRGATPCGAPLVPREAIEADVWRVVRGALLEPEQVFEEFKARVMETDDATLTADMEDARAKLRGLRAEEQKYTEITKRFLRSEIPMDLIEREGRRIQQERAFHEERLRDLQERLTLRRETIAMGEEVLRHLAAAVTPDMLDALTPEQRRDLFASLGLRVEMGTDGITILGAIGTSYITTDSARKYTVVDNVAVSTLPFTVVVGR